MGDTVRAALTSRTDSTRSAPHDLPRPGANLKVIGINNSIESPVDGSVGVGFAIPIDQLNQLLPSLEGGSNV